MDIKTTTITRKEYTVKLDTDDWLIVKIGDGKAFGLTLDLLKQSLALHPIKTGGLVPDPVFHISFDELEDITVSKNTDYIRVSFPMKLYAQVKERLKDLPIWLPHEE